MKSVDLIFQIYSALRQRSDKLRNESERNLVLAVCSAIGGIVSSGIGFSFYILYGLKVAIASFLLASSLAVPISVLIGIYVWELIPPLWLKSGNVFLGLKYLEHEYNRDIDRIERLPMAEAKKAPLLTERYKKYLDDSSRLKEQVLPLNPSGPTKLLK